MRIRTVAARMVARKRLGAKSAEPIALATPGTLEATEALESIQIDHTLAIDVASRTVLGFHLGLEAPSALAVALCIEHAVLPKIPSAATPDTDASWDMFGMPKTILVDNGSEFLGEALARGCAEYGISLTYRPVATPRFGAHIERLIGTMMGKIPYYPRIMPYRRGGFRPPDRVLEFASSFDRSMCTDREAMSIKNRMYWLTRPLIVQTYTFGKSVATRHSQ